MKNSISLDDLNEIKNQLLTLLKESEDNNFVELCEQIRCNLKRVDVMIGEKLEERLI